MELSNWLKLLQRYYYRPLGLLIGYVIILVSYPSFKDSFTGGVLIIIYVTAGLIWSGTWLISRNYFPKASLNKIGLFIAIDAENTKQKTRIKVDFFGNLNNLLIKNNIAFLFDVVVLTDYRSIKAGEILKSYSEKKEEISSSQTTLQAIEFPPKEFVRWQKFIKKTRGHLYIWGDIKERKDQENKYFLKIDSLVVHRPIDIETSDKIRKEFLSIFPKRISFNEKYEVKGFEFSANAVYLASRYITGLAAFISGDPVTAVTLHRGLNEEIGHFMKPLPPNLVHVSKQLKKTIASEKLWIAKHSYFINKNVKHAKKIIKECLEEFENYEALILDSVIVFKEDTNPVGALRSLRRAKKVSQGDFTWLYNKAFILMYLGKLTKGLGDYKKLTKIWFPDEENIVDQCIEFNRELLCLEPAKIQAFFILGYLYYKKKKNYPMALESFEVFQEKAKADKKTYKPLIAPTSSYLSEIRKQMRL